MFDQFLEIVRENYRLSVDFKISQENTLKRFFLPINLEIDKTYFSRTIWKLPKLYKKERKTGI